MQLYQKRFFLMLLGERGLSVLVVVMTALFLRLGALLLTRSSSSIRTRTPRVHLAPPLLPLPPLCQWTSTMHPSRRLGPTIRPLPLLLSPPLPLPLPSHLRMGLGPRRAKGRAKPVSSRLVWLSA
ncbi:hypothetical protein BXZ70DRAFT_950805 [Cristinia sonorae]|uniref:Uncharacterized protein n=1 Tax=Cristinia sonorae TaxID=1940300 RepID=A0A8K0XM73_9AGAR|nr:hypothetical protein BXZ70DRAFT_950805 [Cristinia sonorae]